MSKYQGPDDPTLIPPWKGLFALLHISLKSAKLPKAKAKPIISDIGQRTRFMMLK